MDEQLNYYTIDEFHKKCSDWLIPLGFNEIFKDNHPDIRDFNVHFIKSGIRVECRKRYGREECRLSKVAFSNEITVSVYTGNHLIGFKEFEEIYNKFINIETK
jgi:hypothetical protein